MRRESCITEKKILRKRVPYPTQITGMPNMVGDKVIMDGWYSYTAIIFRNIAESYSS
jgi:hypothetical protein